MNGVELESLPGHLSVLKEVQRDGGSLLAGSRRARDEGIDHVIELLRSKSREELQRSTERRLVDGESLRESRAGLGGSHFVIEVEDVVTKAVQVEDG